MKYEFRNAQGRSCCKSDRVENLCDACKARAAEGKRHSESDQQHLDAAAVHLMQAGASPDDTTAADLAQAHEDALKYLPAGHGTAAEHKAALSRTFAHLRAATRALRAQSAARVPEVRALEELDDVPNGYRAATDAAPYVPEPTDDPAYRPKGTAPDGYKIAIAVAKATKELR